VGRRSGHARAGTEVPLDRFPIRRRLSENPINSFDVDLRKSQPAMERRVLRSCLAKIHDLNFGRRYEKRNKPPGGLTRWNQAKNRDNALNTGKFAPTKTPIPRC
jgi:hypothetical protein